MENEQKVLASNDFPYVLFEVSDNICGVTCSKMLSIQILSQVTPMVNSPDYVRGCTNFRGTFIPLVDIRKMTGQISATEHVEHDINIRQRINDHLTWIHTLQESVENGVDFPLTDNPTMCALGRWHGSFTSDDVMLQKLLKSLEEPHKLVHATATRVKELMANGDRDSALHAILHTRNTHVKEVIRILEQIDAKLHDDIKEMLVVIETVDGAKGLIVDHVAGVEEIESFEPLPAHLSHAAHVTCIGRREKTQEAILIFDCDQIK